MHTNHRHHTGIENKYIISQIASQKNWRIQFVSIQYENRQLSTKNKTCATVNVMNLSYALVLLET
jgi:hypothetical protein